MGAALLSSSVVTLDDLRALAPLVPEGPSVVIDFRPPCPTERLEIFEGPDGVNPLRVVKSLCRILRLSPLDLRTDMDPADRGRRDEYARCYLLDLADQRIACVTGLSAVWIETAAKALASRAWRPGAATPVDPAGWSVA